MKTKFLIIIWTAILYLTIPSVAQTTSDVEAAWHSNNIVKINAIGIFSSFSAFAYERVLSDKFTAQISYGNGITKTISNKDDDITAATAAQGDYYTEEHIKIKSDLVFEFRYYPAHEHTGIPAGFHIGPLLSFTSYSDVAVDYDYSGVQLRSNTVDYKIINIGITVGPQLLIHKMVALDFTISPGFGILTANGSDDISQISYTGEGFTLRFALYAGLAFGK